MRDVNPLTSNLILTPALLALYNHSIISISSRLFILAVIAAFFPAWAFSISVMIMLVKLRRVENGDIKRFFSLGMIKSPCRTWNILEISLAIYLLAVKMA